VVTGTCALVTIVALWGLHFAASGRLMDRYVDTTTDPILAARHGFPVRAALQALQHHHHG
jgi:hypothetical protein